MSFDGTVTRVMVHELRSALYEGKISKIYQPNSYELVMQIRAQGQNLRLLLSAHPVYQRFHLTQQRIENPATPPPFCMLLRKHLVGGRISQITQTDMERVVSFDIRTRNELGDRVIRRLIIEIMGRYSNLILIDPEEQRIIDAMRRVTHAMSQHRRILPGITYQHPPKQNKRHPLLVSQSDFIASLDFNRGRMDRQIVDKYQGIGPLLAKEMVHRAGIGDRDRLWQSFSDAMQQLSQSQYQPTLVRHEGKEFYAIWPLHHIQGTALSFSTMSECLDHFYSDRSERDRIKQRSQDLMRKVRNEISKNKKKIEKIQKQKQEAEKADQYRVYGELVTAHMYQIQRGDPQLEAMNYYDPQERMLTIPLDPRLTASENAQRYFKRYQKLKASNQWNEEQIKKASEEIHYLETVLLQLEQASIQDLIEIKEELEEQGLLKKQPTAKKRRKEAQPAPTPFYSSDGTLIWIGKNNKQNDYLTTRLAKPNDTWLHTKDIPGSHVVIHSPSVSEQTLLEAATLAAYFSKAQASNQVPVDYTLVKHVKKPTGARPGYVIYEQQKTIYATPDGDTVSRLANQMQSK